MPISTKNEILYVYADLLNEPLTKEAADAVDYANQLAIGIGGEIAFAGASAAIAGASAAAGTGIAGGVATGALAGIGSAFGIGSTSATILGLAGPAAFFGPVGITLALGFTAYALWQVSKQTDDNLDDLIDRLEDCDPDKTSEARVNGWIETLKSYKPALEASQTTSDLTERAKMNKYKLDALSKLVAYLKAMQRDWTTTKFTDWGFDASQAKTALDKTTATIEQSMVQMQNTAKEETKKIIQALEQSKGQNYTAIAQNVVNLHKQLTSVGGQVTFDSPDEEEGFKLAQQIISGDVDPQELTTEAEHLIALNTLMDQALKSYTPQQNTAQQAPAPATPTTPAATASIKTHLSKRALTVGGKKFSPQGETQQVSGKGGRRISARNPQVQYIQQVLNHLAARYVPQMERLSEDGVYGVKTAAAMVAILHAVPELNESVVQYAGVPHNYLRDYAKLNRDTRSIQAIYNVFKKFFGKYMGASGGERDEERGGRGRNETGEQERGDRPMATNIECPYDKPGSSLTAQEIDSCIMRMSVREKDGDVMNLAEFLNMYGYRTPEERAEVVRMALGNAVTGLPPFLEWQDRAHLVVNYVKSQKGLEQTGRGQLRHGASRKLSRRHEINKQAFAELKEMILHLWHPERGPLENIFGLMSYLVPFIPGFGWALFIFEKFASLCDLGLADLGKYLDSKLGLGPGSEVTQAHLDRAPQLLEEFMAQKTAATTDKDLLTKQAFWGSLVTKLIPKGFGFVMKAISLILLAVGVDKITDLNKEVQTQGGWVPYGTKQVMDKAVPYITQNVVPQITDQVTQQFTGSLLGQDDSTNSEDE